MAIASHTVQRASISAWNGQAFALLDKAHDERDFLLVMRKVDPMFDPLRSDPRFSSLVQRVGLPK